MINLVTFQNHKDSFDHFLNPREKNKVSKSYGLMEYLTLKAINKLKFNNDHLKFNDDFQGVAEKWIDCN
jgi:hypothetical protein